MSVSLAQQFLLRANMPQYALRKEDVLRNEMLLVARKHSHFYDGKFSFESAS
jgi:hypothetical protein